MKVKSAFKALQKEKGKNNLSKEKLSQKDIRDLLRDDPHLSPITLEKINYFRDHLHGFFLEHRKVLRDYEVSLTDFASLVITRHNERMKKANVKLKTTYFNHDNYVISLANETIEELERYNDPLNPFSRPGVTNPRVSRFQNIVSNRIQTLREIDITKYKEEDKLLLTVIERYYDQKIAGLLLLERALYNDALIIWRSLLETTTTMLILATYPALTGKYKVRRELALMHADIMKVDDKTKEEKSKETKIHAAKKGVPYFTAKRFGWAGSLIKDQDFSLKSLLATVGLEQYGIHYAFASLFVHEYSITEKDFSHLISFEDYLLTLYFQLYETTRPLIIERFTKDRKEEKKQEKRLRTEVSDLKGRFTDFALLISNV